MNKPGKITASVPLRDSQRLCRAIAKKNAGNFFLSFFLLPAKKRQAMCALYSFLRITDDLADSDLPVEVKQAQLADWKKATALALAGEFSHPIHPAFHEMVGSCKVPHEYLFDALEGVAMDLHCHRYHDFSSLYRYCFKVASVVGLSCIHIWEFHGEEALPFAEAAGIALQLTNILRDLGEDARRGRVYLPLDELAQFGYSEAKLMVGSRDRSFEDLMRFQTARAREYYAKGRQLLPFLSRSGRAIFLSLLNTYQALLDSMEKSHFDVFDRRVSLSGAKKISLAFRAFLVAWLGK
ncbi:MAG: phytoene/squalene synthase family protein [Gemmataceae bacterium]|nr:phytoene/squalene synthase family protein [Gemmataceae bacterium]